MNALLLIYNIILLLVGNAPFSKGFITVAAPIYLVSSFMVYFTCVPWYLRKRRTADGIIMLDVLMACASEFCITVLSCFVYSLIWGLIYWSTHSQIHGNFFGSVIGNAFITAIWIVAAFGIQLAVLGIIFGAVGWYLIDKKEMVHIS